MIKTKTDLRTVGSKLDATTLLHQLSQSLWPEGTLRALAEETQLSSMMATDGGDCEEVLRAAGIDINALAERLQDEGTKSFAKSWTSLMAVIASKREPGTKAA